MVIKEGLDFLLDNKDFLDYQNTKIYDNLARTCLDLVAT
jgi:hypothetical protein